MKILSVFAFMALPAFAAEITSPFYLPNAGHDLSQTSLQYTKDKIKASPSIRTYRQNLNEQITLGLGAGIAALLEGNLNWIRQKQEQTLSFPHTKGYGAGLKGSWEFDGFLTQISTLYRQTINISFEPRREIEANLYIGRTLKTMTPYMHFVGFFPLNARPQLNTPIYRAETGVFQSIQSKMTLDTALYLQYDKNTKNKSYGLRAEWSYFLTSWMVLGLNGEWQAGGHAKNNASTYHQAVGCKMTFSF